MNNSIWVIKVIEYKNNDNVLCGIDSVGWFDKSQTRIADGSGITCIDSVGWFESESEAVEIVKHNACDMREGIFDYAVIEEIPSGLYRLPKKRTWWKYKGAEEDAYEQIEAPGFM